MHPVRFRSSNLKSMIDKLEATYGDCLRHLSTIAVHPAVAHLVAGFGYTRASGDVPLYQVWIEPQSRVVTEARHALASSFQDLRLDCVKCQKFPKFVPWCGLPVQSGGKG